MNFVDALFRWAQERKGNLSNPGAKIASSIPAEAVEFFGRKKNSQHAFLRRGSKAVCPTSQLCGMLKNPTITWRSDCLAKFGWPFLAHTSYFRSQRSLVLSGIMRLWGLTEEPKTRG
jgi:hypothetical protein